MKSLFTLKYLAVCLFLLAFQLMVVDVEANPFYSQRGYIRYANNNGYYRRPYPSGTQGFVNRLQFGFRKPQPDTNQYGQAVDGDGIPFLWYT